VVRPASIRRAEQVAEGVCEETCLWERPIGSVEADQHSRRVGIAAVDKWDLEDRAKAPQGTLCRSEQVTGGVLDQTGVRSAVCGNEANQRGESRHLHF